MSLDRIPNTRTLFVPSRNVSAQIPGAVHIKPGGRLAYAVEFKQYELPVGGLLYCGDDNPFAGPSIGGADAANMEVEDYAIHDTQVRFEVSLDEEATVDDVITIGLDVPLSATEHSLWVVRVVVEPVDPE